MSPQRIQRKRTKGWRMPECAVYVGRPSRWGNPYQFRVKPNGVVVMLDDGHRFASSPPSDPDRIERARRMVVVHYEAALRRRNNQLPRIEDIRRDLAGKDLACWCPLGRPCHADVLLKIANGGTP